MTSSDDIIDAQIAYYRARAPEYDRWWDKTGQYEMSATDKAEWDAEVAALEAWVDGLALVGEVLELACGTGIWTQRLARRAASLTALDSSSETIAINRARTAPLQVRYGEANLFTWQPAERYDVVFFSFWLSHVPPDRIPSFWAMVAGALRDSGRAVFIDNRWRPWTWPQQKPEGFVQERTDLSDGSRHQVVKVYYEPADLETQLAAVGWHAEVGATETHFVYGTATPPR